MASRHWFLRCISSSPYFSSRFLPSSSIASFSPPWGAFFRFSWLRFLRRRFSFFLDDFDFGFDARFLRLISQVCRLRRKLVWLLIGEFRLIIVADEAIFWFSPIARRWLWWFRWFSRHFRHAWLRHFAVFRYAFDDCRWFSSGFFRAAGYAVSISAGFRRRIFFFLLFSRLRRWISPSSTPSFGIFLFDGRCFCFSFAISPAGRSFRPSPPQPSAGSFFSLRFLLRLMPDRFSPGFLSIIALLCDFNISASLRFTPFSIFDFLLSHFPASFHAEGFIRLSDFAFIFDFFGFRHFSVSHFVVVAIFFFDAFRWATPSLFDFRLLRWFSSFGSSAACHDFLDWLLYIAEAFDFFDFDFHTISPM